MYGVQIFDYNLKTTLLFDRFNDTRNAHVALESFLHDYFFARNTTWNKTYNKPQYNEANDYCSYPEGIFVCSHVSLPTKKTVYEKRLVSRTTRRKTTIITPLFAVDIVLLEERTQEPIYQENPYFIYFTKFSKVLLELKQVTAARKTKQLKSAGYHQPRKISV